MAKFKGYYKEAYGCQRQYVCEGKTREEVISRLKSTYRLPEEAKEALAERDNYIISYGPSEVEIEEC